VSDANPGFIAAQIHFQLQNEPGLRSHDLVLSVPARISRERRRLIERTAAALAPPPGHGRVIPSPGGTWSPNVLIRDVDGFEPKAKVSIFPYTSWQLQKWTMSRLLIFLNTMGNEWTIRRPSGSQGRAAEGRAYPFEWVNLPPREDQDTTAGPALRIQSRMEKTHQIFLTITRCRALEQISGAIGQLHSMICTI
jgi:hypothetical protein